MLPVHASLLCRAVLLSRWHAWHYQHNNASLACACLCGVCMLVASAWHNTCNMLRYLLLLLLLLEG
jgi:hypothetical protein